MSIFSHFILALIDFSAAYALPALLVLLMIEETGIPIPIPGDILILLAGVVAVDHPPIFSLLVIGCAVVAVMIGSSILFTLMRHGGRRFLARYGKYLHLGPKRVARMERWFQRHHRHALLYGRMIPGLRIPTTALAGMSGLPYRRYLPSAVVAAVIWSIAFFSLGVVLHLEGPLLLQLLRPLTNVVPVPVLIAAAALIVLNLVVGWLLLARRRLVAAAGSDLVPLPPDGKVDSVRQPPPATSPRAREASDPGDGSPAESSISAMSGRLRSGERELVD